jgi:hypothetical protein
MSTPTQPEINAAALAAQEAATAAANQTFIADASVIITNAAAQGQYHVFLSHIKNVSFHDIHLYYRALGYTVGINTCPSWEFGYFYGQYWIGWPAYFGHRKICNCGRPCKIVISWGSVNGNNFGPCAWPGLP